MRITIVICCIFVFNFKAFSQSSTSTPPSSASQSGYVYRLKKYFVIKYAKVDTTISSALRNNGLPPTKIVNQIITTKDILFCDVPANELKYRSLDQGITQKDYNNCKQYSFTTISSDKCDTICVTPCNPDNPPFLTTNITVDSISRYWYWKDNQKDNFFPRHRLRVSVTQGDSGKLKLGIYDNNFEKDSKNIDLTKIKTVKIFSGKNFDGLDMVIGIFSSDALRSIPDSKGFGLLDRILTLVFYAFYMSIVEAIFQGKSLGKVITGTRAVNLDGSRISATTAFARGFSRAVPFCVFSAFGSPCITWQDSWTNTIVIDEKNSTINSKFQEL